MQGWRVILRDPVQSLNQGLGMRCYVHKEEYMGSGTKGQSRSGDTYNHFQRPTEGHCASCSFSSGFCRIGSTVPKGGTLLPGDRALHSIDFSALNYKLQLPPEYFGLLVPEDQQTRVTILAEIIEPKQQEVAGLLLYIGDG